MTKEAMRLLGCDSGLEGWHIQQRALQVYIQILKKYQNLVTIDALGAIFAIIFDNVDNDDNIENNVENVHSVNFTLLTLLKLLTLLALLPNVK